MARSKRNALLVLLSIVLALYALPALALAEMREEPATAEKERAVSESVELAVMADDAGLASAEAPLDEGLTVEDAGEQGVPETSEGDVVASEEVELSTQSVRRLYNPRIAAKSSMKSGQLVTWDCVWFGSYPQAEVPETDALKNANWIDDEITMGNVRYRRVFRNYVSYTGDWRDDAVTWRYFRYEPIKWRVLKVDGSTALVVADAALDCRQYNDTVSEVTWASSTIRSWLNGIGVAPYYDEGAESGCNAESFSTLAFTPEQLGAVRQSTISNADGTYSGTSGGGATRDKFFLLSESEVHGDLSTPHGFASDPDVRDEARRCKPTDFARAMGTCVFSGDSYDGTCWWWLRSPGDGAKNGTEMQYDGRVYRQGIRVDNVIAGVRPAMYLDLSSSHLSWAGTVSSDGTVDTNAKPGSGKLFPDVADDAWYANMVSSAVSLGAMSGYSNGKFGPADKITRGQVAVILWNMAGGPAAGTVAKNFSDVKAGAYFYNAVRWASSRNVVSGYPNGKFGAYDNVTREQLAVMLANYARSVKGQTVTGSAADFASMADKGKVSSWAVPAVGWCFRNQILTGSGGNVNPAGNTDRAEAAKMVVGLYDLLG